MIMAMLGAFGLQRQIRVQIGLIQSVFFADFYVFVGKDVRKEVHIFRKKLYRKNSFLCKAVRPCLIHRSTVCVVLFHGVNQVHRTVVARASIVRDKNVVF